jgi:hypothetical protein
VTGILRKRLLIGWISRWAPLKHTSRGITPRWALALGSKRSSARGTEVYKESTPKLLSNQEQWDTGPPLSMGFVSSISSVFSNPRRRRTFCAAEPRASVAYTVLEEGKNVRSRRQSKGTIGR